MKATTFISLVPAIFGLCTSSQAEPTDLPTTILSIRPYTQSSGSGKVYVRVAQSNLCSTDSFVIELESGGAKQAVAAAMLALAGGNSVQIEIGGACAGVNTQIQSIYILK